MVRVREERLNQGMAQDELLSRFFRLCVDLHDNTFVTLELLTKKLATVQASILLDSPHNVPGHQQLLQHLASVVLGLEPCDPKCSTADAIDALSKSNVKSGKVDSNLRARLRDYCTRRRQIDPDNPFSDIDGIVGLRHTHYVPSSAEDVGDEDIPNQDIANELLYRTIRNNATCTCPAFSSAERHRGCLELSVPPAANAESAKVIYKTAFASCSAAPRQYDWQRLWIEVSSSKLTGKGKHKVRFEGDIGTIPPNLTSSILPGEATNLCRVLGIGYVGPVYRRLQVTPDHELLHWKEVEHAGYDLHPEIGKSLAAVLLEYQLSDFGKIHLAYILASTFWLYYDSSWMSWRWTIDDIRFIRRKAECSENCGTDEFDALRPFIEMRPNAVPSGQTPINKEFLNNDWTLHWAPRILALGVMLVGIFWTPIPPADGDHRLVINTEASRCKEHLDHVDRLQLDIDDKELKDTLVKAIEACFDRSVFQSRILDQQERRSHLLKNVVKPLRRLTKSMGPISTSQTRFHTKANTDNDNGIKARQISSQPVLQTRDVEVHGEIPSVPQGSFASARNIKTPEQWMNSIIQSTLAQELKKSFTKHTPRVKIAILDTGYEPSCVFFDKGRKSRIKEWKDFVQPSSSKAQDTSQNGHGTFVLSLAMTMAPLADFYVARIAEDSHELVGHQPQAARRVVEAIEWAFRKGVNIVSMSFGFDKDQYDMGNLILKLARDKTNPILFFAAASNQGGNADEEDYPAREALVFAVHWTDHSGRLSKHDLKKSTDDSTFIATLGEDITGYKPEGLVKDSGSSFATPITACIAALVLDAVRLAMKSHPNATEVCELLQRLYGFQGMNKMLRSDIMSRYYQHERYHFLSPHNFFNKDADGQWRALQAFCESKRT